MAWAYGLIQHWRNVICVCYESVPQDQTLRKDSEPNVWKHKYYYKLVFF